MLQRVDQLQKQYQLFFELEHDKLPLFIQSDCKPTNRITRLYWLVNGWLLGWIVFRLWQESLAGWPEAIGQIGQGLFLFFLLLLPLHEWLRGFVYKLLGAPKVVYKINWSKLVF